MQKFEQYFVAFWCLTMPVTSFLIIPVVQGTIFAYMLAFASIGFISLKMHAGQYAQATGAYFKNFAFVVMLWIILLCGSQFADMLNHQVNVEGMFALSDDGRMILRSSLFTQSIYLFACVMITLYFRHFFQEAWMKYVYWGAWMLVIYGLYDWTFFLVFHQSGDFIANRTFGQGDHPGSWSQSLNLGGVEILRFKSTLGEPSFLSAVVIPYLFMALAGKKRFLTLLLFGCALLSTSTTVYGGLLACFMIEAFWSEKSRRASVAIVGLVIMAIIAMAMVFPDTFRFLFQDKLSGDTESGRSRLDAIEEYKALFHQFGLLNWIFGVGFGYLYFSLLWSLTANTGLLGVGIFLYAFLKPAYLLPRTEGSAWLKISMVAIVVVVAITLSELFLPTTWMFLGLAYRRLDQLERERWARHNARHVPEELAPELTLTDSAGR